MKILLRIKGFLEGPDSELGLQMRIERLNKEGFGDENPMVRALKRELEMKKQ